MPGYQTDNFYNLDSIIKHLKNAKESYLTTRNQTDDFHVYYTLSKISLDIAIKKSNSSSIRYLRQAKQVCNLKEFDDAIYYLQQLLQPLDIINKNDELYIM
jgi:hypothetical protein